MIVELDGMTPTSLHLREVAIVKITGLNPGHVFMVNDESFAD